MRSGTSHDGPCILPADIRILLRIASPADGSYDAQVPNKTIYVSDGDLPLYQRAQELAGGNLSAAISAALRRYVDVEEGDEKASTRSSSGSGPARAGRSDSSACSSVSGSTRRSAAIETFRVYRGRTGKFVLHIERSPDFTMVNAEGKPAGWRGYLGIGNVSYGNSPGESTLEVVGRSRSFASGSRRSSTTWSLARPSSRPWRTSTSDPRRRLADRRGGEA